MKTLYTITFLFLICCISACEGNMKYAPKIHTYTEEPKVSKNESTTKKEISPDSFLVHNNRSARMGGKTWGKGDGSHFYVEERYFNDSNIPYLIYHSLMNCSSMENEAIRRDYVYENVEYRQRYSMFCTNCMNDTLISMCEKNLLQY